MSQARAAEPGPARAARLFLALLPDASVRAALVRHAEDWRWNRGAARYAPTDWHITLHFLGAVPPERVAALQAALAVDLAPFELRFGEPARWPHGLAVLLPLAVPARLQALYEALGQRLRQQGLRTEERAFRPHITLARHAGAAEPPARWPAWGWAVRSYALMESTGDPAARYRVRQRYGGPEGGPALQV